MLLLGVLLPSSFPPSCPGSAAKPVLWEFFKLYPTPEAAVKADWRELAQLLNPLGLHEKRAQILIRFSGGYFFLLEVGSQIVPENFPKH